MTTATEWRSAVGRTWADLAHLTDRAFSGLTSHLLARISAEPGSDIFDIGCGAAELTIAVAQQRPSARVTGCDISQDLVDVARIRSEAVANVRIIHGDAASLVPAASPDLLMSRHGVMFFDNPVTAFAHLAEVSQLGARLVFSCFRGQEENVWAREIAALLPKPPPLPAAPLYVPGPFAFRDPALVRDILASAGWSDVTFEPIDFGYIAGQGEDPVGDATAFFARIGPCAAAMRLFEPQAREAMRDRLRGVLKNWVRGGEVAFPAAAWIVTATRS